MMQSGRSHPDQHSSRNIIFPDDRLMPAKTAEFPLDEIGVDSGRGCFQRNLAALVLPGDFLQMGKRQTRLFAGLSQRRRLLGQYFVPEKIEPGIGRQARPHR